MLDVRTNIQEQRQSEDALSVSETWFRLARQAAQAGAWEWDFVTNRMQWAAECFTVYGVSPEAFRPSYDTWLNLIHPDDRARADHETREARQSSKPLILEYRVVDSIGNVRWISSVGQMTAGAHPGAERMLGLVTDVTAQRRGEAALRQSETERKQLLDEAQAADKRAEAANRAKDEFIAQVIHNLRSPLNAILGWSKVLRSQSVDEKTVSDALATIQQSAEKQKHLIEDLLEVSRMTTGTLRLDVGQVSLSAVIHSAMEVMRPACEAKQINCEIELAADADSITGDAGRLEQGIWNLVSNAVKFTPSGGEVKVRTERVGLHVQIIVADTGKGIKPTHLPHLFERCWQSDDSSKHRGGGLGLGLSFVRYVVELHGGTIRAESDGEDRGAKFIIILPCLGAQMWDDVETSIITLPQAPNKMTGNDQAEKDQNAALLPSMLNGLLAVIVDDERDARELVAAILRQYGAQVLIAASAAEALHLVQNSPRMPDLLISDISMPEEDGYSLIRKVRALQPDKGGQIPAIALTAYSSMEDRIRVLSSGFQRHIPKPVEPAELALSAAHLTGREIQHLDF